MGNFNLKYNPTKVYSNSEGSGLEHKDEGILPGLDTTSSIAIPNILVTNIVIRTNGELATSSVCTAMNQDFDTLYSPCIASKQTCVVIRNKSMTIVKEKLDKVHINLWGLHHPKSLAG